LRLAQAILTCTGRWLPGITYRWPTGARIDLLALAPQPLSDAEMISPLRVLIANERRDRLELLAQVVTGLGHEVIAREIDVKEVGPVTAREHPDVAFVGLGLSSTHALELIAEIVHTSACPVIALLSARDPAYIHEAARRGVFAYIVDADAEELQSAIDITLQRFAEYQNLQGAFGRRAVIEQAKGILMACHAIDQERAFEMLRSHSQHNGRKLIDVAEAVVESHLLLLPAAAPRRFGEARTG
jgi:AmiR/NasT family two-component response regulator